MARTSGQKVIGIERDEQQLVSAQRYAAVAAETHMVEFRQGDALSPPLEAHEWGSFDVVHTRFLLEHAPGNFLHHPRSRFKYIFYIAFLAALLGAVLIIPFRIMPWHQVAAPFILFLFSLPWVYANAWWVKNVKIVNNEVNHKIQKEPIILLIILLGIFQLLLAPGVVFQ